MTRLAVLIAGLLVLCVLLLSAYLSGWWMPNNPLGRYSVKGIDVSHHQGVVDWTSVAGDGIRFVYLKATEGSDFQDERFETNRKGAAAAGLACGAYHYFTLKSSGMAQAQNFIRTVPKEGLTLPPAIDLEMWGNSADRPSVQEFQSELTVFMDRMRRAYGTEPVIYSSSDFIHAYLTGFPIKRLWYRAVVVTPHTDGFDQWSFWQFTERARVKGIIGFVDMDVFRGSTDDLKLWSRITP
jgi:lysozyme